MTSSFGIELQTPQIVESFSNGAEPVVANIESFRNGKVPFGIDGEPVDAVIFDVVTLTPGMGPTSQAQKVFEGLSPILQDNGIQSYSIQMDRIINGYRSSFPTTSAIVHIPEEVGPVQIEAAYYNEYLAFQQTIQKIIEERGYLPNQKEPLKIGIAAVGYEAISAWGATQAIKGFVDKGYNVKAVTFVYDSTFNSGQPVENGLNDNEIPNDPCAPNAYSGGENNTVWQVAVNSMATGVDPKLHGPGNSDVIGRVSHPFTGESIDESRRIRDIGKTEARKNIAEIYRQSYLRDCEQRGENCLDKKTEDMLENLQNPETSVITVMANSEYYHGIQGAGRKFLTDDQIGDVKRGSELIVEAIDLAFPRQTVKPKKVIVFVPPEMIEIAEGYYAKNGKSNSNIQFAVAPRIQPKEMKYRFASSNLVISRTTQMNSTVEAAFAGVPVMIMNMPGRNFMHSDIDDEAYGEMNGPGYMSRKRNDNLLEEYRYSHAADIATDILNITHSPRVAAQVVCAQDILLDEVYGSPDTNFFDVIQHAFGIKRID